METTLLHVLFVLGKVQFTQETKQTFKNKQNNFITLRNPEISISITENKVGSGRTQARLQGSNIPESSSNMEIAINNWPALTAKYN